jgi:hypothetical protein
MRTGRKSEAVTVRKQEKDAAQKGVGFHASVVQYKHKL